MTYQEEYKSKLCSAAEAVKEVQSGDAVDYGSFNAKPIQCDKALSNRHAELQNVSVFCVLTLPPFPEVIQYPDSFCYNDGHFSKLSRIMQQQFSMAYYVPIFYHSVPSYYRQYINPERRVAILQTTPMDKHGFFNFGPQNSENQAKVEMAEKVILEVNKNMPYSLGGAEEGIHISRVTRIVEAPDDQYMYSVDPEEPSSEDLIIAENIVKYLKDGDVIQLGIGGMSNAIGKMIVDSNLKNLGGHTEMLSDAYIDMILSGKMNSSLKAFDRHRVPYTFAVGSQRLYDFIDRNAGIASCPVNYTNDPRVIAKLDNFVSINSGLQIDLYGQINAESIGSNQISGNGGMTDFVIGSQWSKNGKSYITINSSYKDSAGVLQSGIVSFFKPNSIITIPRQIVDYVVTEWGVARLKAKATWQRAEALINIAHPNFRDDLIIKAEEAKIWRKTNKIA